MEKLDNLIEKLNTDKYSAVSVLDLDTGDFVFRNITHAQIISEHGTAEDFFETLFSQGHKRLNLTPRRKNGSVYKADGQGFEVNFSKESQETQAVMPQTQNIQETQQQNVFQNSFGLGQLDVMNLMVAKNDATRLFTENEILKTETKEQKKLIEELKEEKLATKYDTNKSKGNQEMLMGAIQSLPQLMAMVKGTPAVGLAQPVEYSSPAKNNFAKELPSIDDNVLEVLQSINTGLSSNVEFSNELSELLQKYQLWN